VKFVLDLQACQSPESSKRGIGRYSLSLAKAMVANAGTHDFFIVLSGVLEEEIERLRDEFDGLIPQSRILVWEGIDHVAAINQENRFRRHAATMLREQFISSLNPDVVHIASLFEGLAEDIVSSVPHLPSSALHAVTLYDLIPLASKANYLGDARISDWYHERIHHLMRADVLLGISKYTCDEAGELLDIPTEKVLNIGGAADAIFKVLEGVESERLQISRRYGFERPFIMYAGGFDPRKNIGELVKAFASLPVSLRSIYQLVIVGWPPQQERLHLESLIVRSGLLPNDVVFAGYVPDIDLVKLYNLCHLYVFPSLQEGFGLPALEAMCCGAVVIGSNTTSLPEVIGFSDALFDPRRVDSIAAKLVQALTDQGLRDNLKAHARSQPGKFTWQQSALRAIEAFESTVEKASRKVLHRTSINQRVEGLAVAWLPCRSRTHFPAAEWCQIDTFAGESCPALSNLAQARSLLELAGSTGGYDLIVAELDDDPYIADVLLALHKANCPVHFRIRADRIGHALRALIQKGKAGRDLLAGIVYLVGGYAALLRAQQMDWVASLLSDLVPVRALADAFWCVKGTESTSGDEAEIAHPDEPRQGREELLSSLTKRVDIDFASRVANLPEAEQVGVADLARIARAYARNSQVGCVRKQLLVDISTLAVRDAGTGIQRVVRNVLTELLRLPPEGFRVEPVFQDEIGRFRYARSYCAARYFGDIQLPADDLVEFGHSDIFYGLDLTAHLVPQFRGTFDWMRQRGVEIYFLLHDLLPILRRDCFDPAIVPTFRAWYEVTSEIADGIVCVSHAVAVEYQDWLDVYRPLRRRPIKIGVAYSGVEFNEFKTSEASEANVHDEIIRPLGDRITFLMVGTIEPRKGCSQVLLAFEWLWSRGIDVNLVLVGKQGWLVEELTERIRSHPELGRRLFWLTAAADDMLVAMYRRANALVMASEGEGFGLPIIEAAHYGVPLLLRDIAVFREVAGEHATYFSGYDPESLGVAIFDWLDQRKLGRLVTSDGISWHSWRRSTDQVIELIRDRRWPYSWMPSRRYVLAAYDVRMESAVGEFRRECFWSTGRQGLLASGPGVAVPAGRYRVTLTGIWTEANGCAWLDLVSSAGNLNHLHIEMLPCGLGEMTTIMKGYVELEQDVDDLELKLGVGRSAGLAFRRLELYEENIAHPAMVTELALLHPEVMESK
jgi:glycosyltransferase involved in cell wall biosynthesis